MIQAAKDSHPLSGVTVLVVEDDPLMAMDLEDTLAEAGALVVGLCQSLDEAMARANVDDFAVAVLESLNEDSAGEFGAKMLCQFDFASDWVVMFDNAAYKANNEHGSAWRRR